MKDTAGLGLLDEKTWSTMAGNAINACLQAQGDLQNLIGQVVGSPGNGKASILHIPGQNPVVMNAPPEPQVRAAQLQSIALALQGIRALLVMVNDLDTRLRLKDHLNTPQDTDSSPCVKTP